jgi:hypothetical protein
MIRLQLAEQQHPASCTWVAIVPKRTCKVQNFTKRWHHMVRLASRATFRDCSPWTNYFPSREIRTTIINIVYLYGQLNSRLEIFFSRQHGWKLKRVQLQTLKLSSTGVCITTGYVRTWVCALMFRNNSHFSLCPPLSIICIPALPNNPEDRRIPVNRSRSLRSRQWIFGLSWYYARTDTLQQHNLFKPHSTTNIKPQTSNLSPFVNK